MGRRTTTEGEQTPQEPGRTAVPQATPATLPSMLMSLQGSAGNRAVTTMMADPRNLAPAGLMYPDPAPPRSGETWNLEFHMSGRPQVFTGLDDEGVIKQLQSFYFALLDDMRNGQQAQEHWRTEMDSEFGTRWAAAASSLAGGADWPDPGNWLEVDKQISGAFFMLRESLWSVMARRDDPMDAAARAQAKPLTAERMAEIVAILERGEVAAAKCWSDWRRFLDDSETGAERAVTGLKWAKVAGAVAITYLTAGAAAEAQLGYWGTTAALAGTGGTYAAAQTLAEQGGEMLFGDRDHIDWGSVAKAGVVNAAASFVGGAVAGKFAGILGNSLGRMVGGLSPEVMQAFGIQGAQLLTNGERIFVAWLGNVASSPFQTSTTVLMQSALDGRWTVTSTGDFFDLVLRDMVLNGSIGGLLSFAQAYGASRPAGDGADGGGPPGGEPPGRGPGADPGDTLTGMGAAGPAGENAPPVSRDVTEARLRETVTRNMNEKQLAATTPKHGVVAAGELHLRGPEPPASFVEHSGGAGIGGPDAVHVLRGDEVPLPGQIIGEVVPSLPERTTKGVDEAVPTTRQRREARRSEYLDRNRTDPEHPGPRSHDAEKKILADAAAHLARNPSAQAELHMMPSHPPCPACTAAIFAFRGDHPNVTVFLYDFR